ncbi:MAG: TIGR01620 family protein [Geminicoccaceae bacterium]
MSERRTTVRPFELDPARPDLRPEPPPLPPTKGIDPADESTEETAAVLAQPPRRRSWRAKLAGLFGIGLVGALVVQAVDYVESLLLTSPLLGIPFAIFLLLTVAAGLGYAWVEIRDLRRLSRRAEIRQEADRLAQSELHGQAEPLLKPILAELEAKPEFKSGVLEYTTHASDVLDDRERLTLFERKALAPVDRKAYRLVLEGARDIGVLTALAPTGLLDGVLVLWRTTLMLRAIARLYGMAPGPAVTASLLRRCIRNAALAGVADMVTQAALEHVGASLVALLSARAGQGAGNALLAGRLGIECMRVCRPLPFIAEEPPRLANVRKALFGNGDKKK